MFSLQRIRLYFFQKHSSRFDIFVTLNLEADSAVGNVTGTHRNSSGGDRCKLGAARPWGRIELVSPDPSIAAWTRGGSNKSGSRTHNERANRTFLYLHCEVEACQSAIFVHELHEVHNSKLTRNKA